MRIWLLKSLLSLNLLFHEDLATNIIIIIIKFIIYYYPNGTIPARQLSSGVPVTLGLFGVWHTPQVQSTGQWSATSISQCGSWKLGLTIRGFDSHSSWVTENARYIYINRWFLQPKLA
jgi:hypothetical protein